MSSARAVGSPAAKARTSARKATQRSLGITQVSLGKLSRPSGVAGMQSGVQPDGSDSGFLWSVLLSEFLLQTAIEQARQVKLRDITMTRVVEPADIPQTSNAILAASHQLTTVPAQGQTQYSLASNPNVISASTRGGLPNV